MAVGTMADMLIQPWAALLIGSLAATISVLGYHFVTVRIPYHITYSTKVTTTTRFRTEKRYAPPTAVDIDGADTMLLKRRRRAATLTNGFDFQRRVSCWHSEVTTTLKCTVVGLEAWDRQTDGQTDRQTDAKRMHPI